MAPDPTKSVASKEWYIAAKEYLTEVSDQTDRFKILASFGFRRPQISIAFLF